MIKGYAHVEAGIGLLRSFCRSRGPHLIEASKQANKQTTSTNGLIHVLSLLFFVLLFSRRSPRRLTPLQLEAQFLLLVRKVAGGGAQDGHADGAGDARDLPRAGLW